MPPSTERAKWSPNMRTGMPQDIQAIPEQEWEHFASLALVPAGVTRDEWQWVDMKRAFMAGMIVGHEVTGAVAAEAGKDPTDMAAVDRTMGRLETLYRAIKDAMSSAIVGPVSTEARKQ